MSSSNPPRRDGKSPKSLKVTEFGDYSNGFSSSKPSSKTPRRDEKSPKPIRIIILIDVLLQPF